MPKHSGSDGFQEGIPGICDECFRESRNAKSYYCPHNGRSAVYKDGYWETFRDVSPEDATKLVQEAIELVAE